MNKLNTQARISQQVAMTPQLLQSIRLLQLSTIELEQELQQALAQNVMLEGEDDEMGGVDVDPAADEAQRQDVEVSGVDPAAEARVEADYDWSTRDSWSGGEPPADADGESWEARLTAAPQTDARLVALEQLQLVVADERQAALCTAIVDAVDDNGYLTQPLDGIALESALRPLPDARELQAALALVQGVEPSGFAARDLRECLLLQLAALPAATPGRALAQQVVDAHLDALGAHDYAEVGNALGVDAVDLHAALDLILSLNPKPASALAAPADAALPDLIVSGTPGAWRVELNVERLPRVRVNAAYERMLGATAHRALRDQLQEARWLVRGLEMRHDTLLRTGRAIFERQAEFLARGEEGMASLTLREIADRIGMHESTVCRVTTNKWVATPWGVYELKAFFPSQIAGRGLESSGTAVKAMIRRIINAENATSPLSDGEITALLARQGIEVARRTVAKYREAMRIPPVKERLPRDAVRRLSVAG
ncbi:RNA polymerase factor sigma-54 [Solimonas marina]|uniref:RNA polymerase sigma-54 factor n=1 Tax=Solimonas marina TaxID=2714601 RepID=A0A970B649_9GAMM|nr:RNA polymerase factor sigma-54 [Solimonas marina]NKF24082.1 RNA polymerase factor sigma-54 [Solimonas marina]